MEAGRNVKEKKGLDNNLLELIAADPAFNMSLEELKETMETAEICRSCERAGRVVLNNVIYPLLEEIRILGVKLRSMFSFADNRQRRNGVFAKEQHSFFDTKEKAGRMEKE